MLSAPPDTDNRVACHEDQGGFDRSDQMIRLSHFILYGSVCHTGLRSTNKRDILSSRTQKTLIPLAELSRLGLHFRFGLVGVSGLGFGGLGCAEIRPVVLRRGYEALTSNR